MDKIDELNKISEVIEINEMDNKLNKAGKMKRKLVLFSVIFVGALFVYAFGFVYFSMNLLPRTSINGRQYGCRSVDYAVKDLENPGAVITLIGKEGTREAIDLSEIEYKMAVDFERVQEIKNSQTPYIWFVEFFKHKNYEVETVVQYNEEMLYALAGRLELITKNDIVAPRDAYIEKVDDGFKIVPEQEGDMVAPDLLQKALLEAVNNRQDEVNLLRSGCYAAPRVRSDSPEIQETLEKLDQMQNLTIIYDFGDREEVLDYNTFSPWINLNNGHSISIDPAQAKRYMEKLAATYNTFQTARRFNTTNYGEITVKGGTYGWLIDIEKSVEQLTNAIIELETKKIKPVYKSYASSRGDDDIGNTYIEVSLTEQHMWFYVNGKLFLETDIVSGLPTEERETPTGVYYIWSKENGRFLSGDDYNLWVDYWLPVDWTGVGIHDAVWQSSFGGDRYLVYGSHGCINTPYQICQQIFEQAELGTPVIIYKMQAQPKIKKPVAEPPANETSATEPSIDEPVLPDESLDDNESSADEPLIEESSNDEPSIDDSTADKPSAKAKNGRTSIV